MAKLMVCSVFDTKIGAYSAPFCCKTRGEAIRSFSDACKDPNLPFGKHPADYQLYALAVFDDNDGSYDSHQPERIIGADEFSDGS